MRKFRCLVLLASWSCAVPAHAVVISNLTSGTTLFLDNFETGGFSPSVGSWSIAGPDVTVTGASSPGPAEGSLYASLFRNSNQLSQGNLQAAFTTQSTAGDVIQLRMMVWVPNDGQDARGQFILDDGDFSSARAWIRPDGTGHVEAVGPGTSLINTGLTYTPGVWQEWDLTYAIGATSFTATVNGASASGLASFTSGNISHADLFNGVASPGGTLFLDAVPPAASVGSTPEPSTLWFAPAGLLFFSMRRRRFRLTA